MCWLQMASGWLRAYMKMTNVWSVFHSFRFEVFWCFLKMMTVCIVLLTIRFGGFMVHKVNSSHDLSWVLVKKMMNFLSILLTFGFIWLLNDFGLTFLAYYSFWWLHGDQGQSPLWFIMCVCVCVCLLLQHTSVSWTCHKDCKLTFSVSSVFFLTLAASQ